MIASALLPLQVAAKIVQGLKCGNFCITVGLEGFLVGLATAGFSPCFSVFDATFQVQKDIVCASTFVDFVSTFIARHYFTYHVDSKGSQMICGAPDSRS